ncbi:NEUR [Mytilus edulis]|uniref:NEUR n=1 Tax=Mytilus edulis TaxID=6550 RepID=A0A8S3QI21_MYTED|nr:NEUR [Mytilus edulis]
MGNHSSSHSGKGFSADLTGVNTDWPIQFHDIHGDNVALSHDKARARRADSFCKSICFSNRPIAINERVYLKFSQTSSSWSGVLRFGFTSLDPGSTQGPDLPRYACPDMTNKPGNWAKALGERYAAINNVLHFWYNRNGDVMFGINGEDIGLFFTGVATNTPLWALMDIYGNTIEIEFVKFASTHSFEVTALNVSASSDCSRICAVKEFLGTLIMEHYRF